MMRVQRNMSQILIVDIQDKVLPPIAAKKSIVDNSIRIIKTAQILQIPITVSEEYPQGLGPTVQAVRDHFDADVALFKKIYFSCMLEDPLRHHIQDHRDNARGQIIVAGLEAHVCVLQTVLDLITDGFEVFVVADAIGSRAESSKQLAIRRMDKAGAFIVDTEMVMFEWLQRAGNDEFKSLLPLIK
jgi:isochorismate hydrolase